MRSAFEPKIFQTPCALMTGALGRAGPRVDPGGAAVSVT
jgi:hypothetical protein